MTAKNKNTEQQVNQTPVNETPASAVPAKIPPSPSERFTNAVIREFSSNAGGELELSGFQKKLCQNYFIKIDMILKDAEARRLKKSEQYRDAVPVTWDNVNMQKLATDVIIFSSVGLDPTQPNHVNPIPYKIGTTGKYDINFTIGYRGLELKAKKYGLEVPDEVIVELVYAKDKFQAIKKDKNNEIESYVFEMSDDFDRGELVGGFYYHNYFSNPKKNKIKTMSKKDIDKRRPDNASAEFWGGKKEVWENKQKVTVEVEGWYEEMAYKTVYRAAYNAITIDSQKIDSNYLGLILRESESNDNQLRQEIAANANKKEMAMEDVEHTLITDSPVINQSTDQPAAQQQSPTGNGQAELFQENQRPY